MCHVPLDHATAAAAMNGEEDEQAFVHRGIWSLDIKYTVPASKLHLHEVTIN